jgi:hypothetical protein
LKTEGRGVPLGFVKSLEEIQAFRGEAAEFYGAEMLMVFWETRPEIIAGLLPLPIITHV